MSVDSVIRRKKWVALLDTNLKKGFQNMNLQEHRRKVLGKLGFIKRGGTKHERWVLIDASTGKPHVTARVSRID